MTELLNAKIQAESFDDLFSSETIFLIASLASETTVSS